MSSSLTRKELLFLGFVREYTNGIKLFMNFPDDVGKVGAAFYYPFYICYKNISKYKFHKVKSDVVIDSLEYFVNIIKKWDEKSKEINGWRSCYLTYKIVGDVLRGIRRKYGYISKIIQFSNVDEIYQIADVINKKIIPLNNLIFGLFVAIEEHSNYNDFYNLQQIFEVLLKVKFYIIFHIINHEMTDVINFLGKA